VWLADSGTSVYITHKQKLGSLIIERSKKGHTVSLDDNKECEVISQGTALIERLINGMWYAARIENVFHVPDIRKNLFSIGECTDKGFKVFFEKKWTKVQEDGETVAIGVKPNKQNL